MSGTSAAPPQKHVRSRTVSVILVSALVTLGLQVPQAAFAATNAALSGTGPGSSRLVELDAGAYMVDLSYSGNVESHGATNFIAHLETTSGNEYWSLANDIDSASSVEQIIRLHADETIWVDVDAAQGSTWSVSLKRVNVEEARRLPYAADFTGRRTTGPLHMPVGLYTATVRYSGNVERYGATNFIMSFEGVESWGDTIFNDIATSGSITKNLRVTEPGPYWFNVTNASENANWSISVQSLTSAFSSTPAPTITGSTRVGSTLTAKPGTWKPSGATLTYQWYRENSRISGATKSTYKLVPADAGETIKVSVTGSKAGYQSATTMSEPTATIATGKLTATPTPKISGTAKVKKTLKVKTGSWRPSGITFSYQWYRGNSKISGATKSSYKLVKNDKGKKIKVKVTGTKSGYASVTKTSKSTGKIKK